jgi:hypothetical protein
MTKDEFMRRRKALVRESPRFDLLAGATVIALAILGVRLSRSASEAITYAYIGFLLVISVAYLAYSWRWAKRTGLLCHSCGRPMLRRAADMVLETGTCPHCRKPAFGQHDSSFNPRPLRDSD